MRIFDKNYDSESICDAIRDVSEAFDGRFNPIVSCIPVDEHGFQKGTFDVIITWNPGEPTFVYEIHVTVEGGDADKFRDTCNKIGVKPIIIDLEKSAESIGQEMMTSSKVFRGPEIPVTEANLIKKQLIEYGFKVTRVKIEVDPSHPQVPSIYHSSRDTPQHDFQHFESHLEIVLSNEEERDHLREFVTSFETMNNKLHFSKNIFKKLPGGRFIQMLTLRDYHCNYEVFKIMLSGVRQSLSEAGFIHHSSSKVEYCIADSSAEHDFVWLK